MRIRAFGLLAVLLLASVSYGGVLFSSNWRSGLGGSETNLLDNGLWDYDHNPYLLSIKRGAPGGHNYLAVGMQDMIWTGVIENNCYSDQVPDHRIRDWQREGQDLLHGIAGQ